MEQSFSSIIFENPMPHLYPRNSAFPNAVELADGRLLAAHQMGVAFESVDGATFLSESTDGGKTWSEPWKAFTQWEGRPISECAKLTCLPDGRLLLLGYAFYRDNPNLPLGNAQTGGLLEDFVFWAESSDDGKTWSQMHSIPNTWNGHTEASAPITVLHDGSWAAPITGFPTWEGEKVSKDCGRILRSCDEGKTWNDDVICMEFPGNTVLCYEQRMCQLSDGTIVTIAWNEDTATGARMHNHIAISTDNGKTFSQPIDTGIQGQASGILALDGTKVLTVHALRRDTDEPGIYACVADVAGGEWKLLSREKIWAPKVPMIRNTYMAEVFAFIKFGQPGVMRLADGNILLTFWFCEEGCYKTVVVKYKL